MNSLLVLSITLIGVGAIGVIVHLIILAFVHLL